jgi:hypothetical protein
VRLPVYQEEGVTENFPRAPGHRPPHAGRAGQQPQPPRVRLPPSRRTARIPPQRRPQRRREELRQEADVVRRLLNRDRDHWQVEVPPDDFGNLAHRDALFGNPVQPHARHRGIDGQPEQLARVDAVTAAQWLDPWPG